MTDDLDSLEQLATNEEADTDDLLRLASKVPALIDELRRLRRAHKEPEEQLRNCSACLGSACAECHGTGYSFESKPEPELWSWRRDGVHRYEASPPGWELDACSPEHHTQFTHVEHVWRYRCTLQKDKYGFSMSVEGYAKSMAHAVQQAEEIARHIKDWE